MYVMGSMKENRIVKFLSSISLEMFIIQSIPISIFVQKIQVTSTIWVILLVILFDILIAYFMHKIVILKLTAK